jgi:hypothetical protein
MEGKSDKIDDDTMAPWSIDQSESLGGGTWSADVAATPSR